MASTGFGTLTVLILGTNLEGANNLKHYTKTADSDLVPA